MASTVQANTVAVLYICVMYMHIWVLYVHMTHNFIQKCHYSFLLQLRCVEMCSLWKNYVQLLERWSSDCNAVLFTLSLPFSSDGEAWGCQWPWVIFSTMGHCILGGRDTLCHTIVCMLAAPTVAKSCEFSCSCASLCSLVAKVLKLWMFFSAVKKSRPDFFAYVSNTFQIINQILLIWQR